MIGYRHQTESETTLSIDENGRLIRPIDAKHHNRITRLCEDETLSTLAVHEDTRVVVVNGNYMPDDVKTNLLSNLAGHMLFTFLKCVQDCIVLHWACETGQTDPKPMVVSLLGQLLRRTKIAMPIPDRHHEDWSTLSFSRLLQILHECMEVQFARTPVLCIIDSVQYYEEGDAPERTKDVLKMLFDLAVNFKNTADRPSRVNYKVLVTSLGKFHYLTEENDTIKILDVLKMVGGPRLSTIDDVSPYESTENVAHGAKQEDQANAG